MNTATKYILLTLAICLGARTMAREPDAGAWKPLLGMELTSELQATHAGDYNFVNLLRLNAALPVTRTLTFELATLSTCMTAGESIGGDLQTFSNLDAGRIPLALSQCHLTLALGDHTLSAGVRNMNQDYFCSQVTSLFTNSSCGIYPTISANYPIANYPVASVGAHYRYEKTCHEDLLTIQASLYNGTGYSRFAGRDNVFRFCPHSDGLFGLAEAAYSHRGSSYFLGTSVYHNRHNRGLSATAPSGTSVTPWFYAEQRISDRLSLIAGYSHAFATEAQCTDFAGIGGQWQWRNCTFGLFTDYAHFGEGSESATELTCQIALNPHISIQPTLHAIFTPEGDDTFHAAAALRLGITF